MTASPETPAPARLVVVRETVKWGDCDPAGVVYTPRFADYAVSAYHHFLGKMLGNPLQKRLAELDLGLPMKAMSFEFRRFLRPDQTFDMTVRVAGVRTRTFDLRIEGTDDGGESCFAALMSPICIKPQARTSIPIPDDLRQRLLSYGQ
jgi:acyl-CoA thioester hydrolase